jgi:hypothetical protein
MCIAGVNAMRILMTVLMLLAAGCAGENRKGAAMDATVMPGRTVRIELLALDLKTCGRCTGTDRNLEEAIETVAGVFREAGASVEVVRHVVTSARQAERLRFVSSPTIRVDGRDIALELRESNCGDCGDICGCEGGVDCRVWVWQGREYTEAPKAMIVDALLRAYSGGPPAEEAAAYELPENLRAYFAALSAKAEAASDCCDRTACCEVSEKAACCGEAASGACGCR